MTCQQLIEFLNEYVDGDLPIEQRRRFDEHLGICLQCRKYLDSYRKTIRITKEASIDEVDIPERLVQAILAAKSGQS